MTLLYGPLTDKRHLLQFCYLPENIGRPLTKDDYIIMYAHAALIDDEDAIAILEELPFSTLLIEADDHTPSTVLREKTTEKCFGGNGVHLSETVFCLTDCCVYNVDRLKLLVLPFGQSVDNAADKVLYDLHLKKRAKCRRLLERKRRKVDFIISCLAPYTLLKKKRISGIFDYNTLIIDRFLDGYEYRRWYHINHSYDSVYKEKYISVLRTLHLLEKEDKPAEAKI